MATRQGLPALEQHTTKKLFLEIQFRIRGSTWSTTTIANVWCVSCRWDQIIPIAILLTTRRRTYTLFSHRSPPSRQSPPHTYLPKSQKLSRKTRLRFASPLLRHAPPSLPILRAFCLTLAPKIWRVGQNKKFFFSGFLFFSINLWLIVRGRSKQDRTWPTTTQTGLWPPELYPQVQYIYKYIFYYLIFSPFHGVFFWMKNPFHGLLFLVEHFPLSLRK